MSPLAFLGQGSLDPMDHLCKLDACLDVIKCGSNLLGELKVHRLVVPAEIFIEFALGLEV